MTISPSLEGPLPNFSSHTYGVRFSRIHQPPVARYASLTGVIATLYTEAR